MGVKSNYIMMSGYDDFQYACEALRCGAVDYLWQTSGFQSTTWDTTSKQLLAVRIRSKPRDFQSRSDARRK